MYVYICVYMCVSVLKGAMCPWCSPHPPVPPPACMYWAQSADWCHYSILAQYCSPAEGNCWAMIDMCRRRNGLGEMCTDWGRVYLPDFQYLTTLLDFEAENETLECLLFQSSVFFHVNGLVMRWQLVFTTSYDHRLLKHLYTWTSCYGLNVSLLIMFFKPTFLLPDVVLENLPFL